jgi:hypothetical protein
MADSIKITITGEASSAKAALQSLVDQTSQLSGKLNESGSAGAEAGRKIADGMQKAEYSTMEARHAAMLLGEETGVKIPRALAGIAAKSEVLGPLLASAFSGIALIAFADLLVKGTEKLTDWIAKTFIFTDAMKAIDSITKAVNADIVDQEAKLKGLKEAYDLIGLTGSALSAKKFEFFNADQLEPAEKMLQEMKYAIEGFGNSGQTAAHNIELVNGYISQMNRLLPKGEQMTLLPSSADEATALDTLKTIEFAYQKNIDTLRQEGANRQKQYEEEVSKETIEANNRAATAQLAWYSTLERAHKGLIEEEKKEDEEAAKIREDQLKQQLEAELKAAEAAAKAATATVKAAEAQLGLNAATAKVAAESEADAVARDKAVGHIRQAVADEQKLVQLLEQEKAAALAVVDAKIQGAAVAMESATYNTPEGQESADYQDALAQYREFQAQRIQIAAEADKKIQAADDAQLKQGTKAYQSYLNTFSSQFASAFAQVMMGHETLGKAAAKMYEQMTQALLTNLAKAAMAELEGALLHKTLAKEQQFDDAKNAAGGAWKAMSGIPVVGPALGAAAAALAFAGVMAFDEGGMAPGGMSLLHPNEAVLNPEQTRNFQQMTEQGGGSTTHNYGDVHISAVDAASLTSLFKKNPGAVAAGVMQALRGGHLSAAKIARGK